MAAQRRGAAALLDLHGSPTATGDGWREHPTVGAAAALAFHARDAPPPPASCGSSA